MVFIAVKQKDKNETLRYNRQIFIKTIIEMYHSPRLPSREISKRLEQFSQVIDNLSKKDAELVPK